jgi:hypothetical protein
MGHSDIEVRVQQHGDGLPATHGSPRDASLGELFKSLTSDSAELIRQEVDLAKTEFRELGAAYARDAAQIGIAAGLAFVGVLALSAFLVIGLGNVMGGRYWLSSLVVGILAAGIGYMMVTSAVKDMKSRGVKPRQTLQTLKDDKAWVGQQARELKQDLTADPTKPAI